MTKKHILEEIKRTAEANGKTPLGRQRFFQETGIKESDWIGKHWARWGDALKDAGYAPNEKQQPLGDDYLLGKLADFIRDLGRFPVKMELRMQKRTDSTFPNEKTLDRFGTSKVQRAARVIEYCRIHQGYEDVIAICEPVSGELSSVETDNAGAGEIGFVYMLKSGRFYKIGRSNAAGRRERELSIQLPEKAVNRHVIRTDDPAGIEAYWHNRFSTKRKGGEWFDLTSEDVKAFCRRKFM